MTSLRNFINNQRMRMIFARFVDSLWVREKNRLNVIPACRKRRLKGKPVEEWRCKVNDVSERRRCLWNLITWIIIKQQECSKQQRQPGQNYEKNRRTCDLLNNDPSLKPHACKRSSLNNNYCSLVFNGILCKTVPRSLLVQREIGSAKKSCSR